MKLFKKLSLLLGSLFFAIGAFSKADFKPAKASSDIALTGIQVRGDANAQYYKFVVLIAENFNGRASKQVSGLSSLNTANKISIYLSENSEPVKLASITDNFAQQNLWAQPGLFINISDANYETYNGATIYKITIDNGCEIPVDGLTYTTTKPYSFVNANYGNASAKYSGFSWSAETIYTPGTASVSDVQLRGEQGNAYFGIVESRYSSLSTSTVCTDLNKFNLLNKVKFYMSEDDESGVFLSSLTSATSWQENMWASSAIMVKIDNDKYETYNGSTVYAIEILEGCHIPCGELDLTIPSGLFYLNQHLGDQSYKYSNYYWGVSKHYIKADADINGIQLRGDKDTETEYFFVIRDERYLDITKGLTTNDKTSFNVLDKVIIYASKEDEGISLRNVVTSDAPWILNQWESGGIMFRISKQNYSLYNGKTVFAIELLEGLTIPCGDYKLELQEGIKFYNSHFDSDSYIYEAFDWSLTEPYDPINFETILTSVQLRADIPSKEYYFVLQAEEYIEENPGDFIGNKEKFNILDKVTLHASKDDKTGTKLSTLADTNKPWRINLWESHGLMILLKESAYETFNGASTYGVTVEEGATLPLSKDMLTITEGDYFVNTVYQNESYYDSGFYFVKSVKDVKDFGTVSITKIQNRANDAARWLMVSVSEPFDQYMIVTALVDELNTLDKIKIYYEENGTPTALRDINENIFENYLFGEDTTLGIRISLDDKNTGPNMYKIVFEEGCQIPYYKNGEYGYMTVKHEFVFSNDDYKKTGNIFNVYDENGLPRLYEQWCVNWSSKVIVNFEVEGIEGYSIPSIEASQGEYIDLTIFNVDGYDLSITTSYGSAVYQGFAPEESGITLLMHYEPSQKEEKPKGCNGNVNGTLLISVLAISLLSLLLVKRKEER